MAADLIMRATTNGLGGAPSAVEISSTPMNNIFDNVSHTEAITGDTEYRAIDLYNDGDALSAGTAIYMKSQTVSTDTEIQMGISAAPIDNTLSVATESDAPSAVTFASRVSGSELTVGDIPAGSYARVWLSRIVDVSAGNQSNDIGTIAFVFA